MNKGFEELNQFGIKGIAAFWLRNFLFLLPIGLAIFSIYWIALSSNKIWLVSIGGSILTANVFLALVSLASFAFLLLCCLNKQIIYSVEFTHHLFAIISFVGQIICCILMSLSSSTNTDIYLKSIEDYCQRNPSNNIVGKFISKNPSEYSRFKYVAKRSTDLYPSISAFFGLWFASTVIYLICSSGLLGMPPEHAPLLTNQQQSEVHQDSSHQDQEQPAHDSVQPWVQDTDNEHHDDVTGDDQGEINITTNSNVNEANSNKMQSPIQTNPNWIIPPETENPEENNNPKWVTTQAQDVNSIPNYEYSYDDEEE